MLKGEICCVRFSADCRVVLTWASFVIFDDECLMTIFEDLFRSSLDRDVSDIFKLQFERCARLLKSEYPTSHNVSSVLMLIEAKASMSKFSSFFICLLVVHCAHISTKKSKVPS